MDLLLELGPSGESDIGAQEKRTAMEEVFGTAYAGRFRDAVTFARKTFHSPPAKQFFKRDFPLISRTLHLESVYRRYRDFDATVLDAFAALSARKLADIIQLLTVHTQRLLVLCKANGMHQGHLCTFLRPSMVVVPIIAPGSGGFLQVLEKLDTFYTLTSSAAMYGVLDGAQRKDAEMVCRKAVRAYGAMVRSESGKLKREAIRVRSKGILSEEVAAAEAALDEGVRQYDSDLGDEERHETSSRLDGERTGGEPVHATHSAATPSVVPEGAVVSPEAAPVAVKRVRNVAKPASAPALESVHAAEASAVAPGAA